MVTLAGSGETKWHLWQITRFLNQKPSVKISGMQVWGMHKAQACASKLGTEAVLMVWLWEGQRGPWEREQQSLA